MFSLNQTDKNIILGLLEQSNSLALDKKEALKEFFKEGVFRMKHPNIASSNQKMTSLVAELSEIVRLDTSINKTKVTNGEQEWYNLLFHGRNTDVMSKLKGIIFQNTMCLHGGIKLIYIDPPFAVGTNRKVTLHTADQKNSFRCFAYKDVWDKQQQEYSTMLWQCLTLCKELLADDGSIYVHCDWRANSLIRLLLDEIFSPDNFRNEIIWESSIANTSGHNRKFIKSHDTILSYTKTKNYIWNDTYTPYSDSAKRIYKYNDKNGYYQLGPCDAPGGGGYFYDLGLSEKTPSRGYSMPKEKAIQWIKEGLLIVKKNRVPLKKWYLNKQGVRCKDVWNDIGKERGYIYATQKPEKLLQRIILSSSNPGDIVADFFCGSGTTLVTAEKTNRKWIGADFSKLAIHSTKKRLLSINNPYNSFKLFNIGNNSNSSAIKISSWRTQANLQKDKFFKESSLILINKILTAYKASKVKFGNSFNYVKYDNLVLVSIGKNSLNKIDLTRLKTICDAQNLAGVTILGFEFDQQSLYITRNLAARLKIKLIFRYIPQGFNSKIKFREDDFYPFHFVEARPVVEKTSDKQKLKFSIELTNFTPSTNLGEISKNWADWIDYWGVNFVGKADENNKYSENIWQGLRLNKQLALKTPFFKIPISDKTVQIKVYDIFGNDSLYTINIPKIKSA